MMEIKSVSGAVLYRGDSAESLREAVIVATRVGANLSAANLSGAFLSGANLSGANMSGAYLRGANMSGANLSGANMSGAFLRGANLSGANMSGAYLRGADLRGAYLRGANMSGANLSGAYLSGADLGGANLSGAYLRGADLSGANLSGADLSGADLSGACLRDGVRLIGARPVVQVGPIGSRSDWLVAYLTDGGIRIDAGCQRQITRAEFETRLANTHGDDQHAREYRAALAYIDAHAAIWSDAA